MNIKIHTQKLDMTDPLRTYAERHIRECVQNNWRIVKADVSIEIAFVNADRKTQCQVTVQVPGEKLIAAEGEGANPYEAVDLTAAQIVRELRRLKEAALRAE